jgi:uncharacterized membrane protein YhaH (DUF805 family)
VGTGVQLHWYIDVLKNYVGFSGRARRKEFWIFTLISAVISAILSLIDHFIGTDGRSGNGMYSYGGGLLSGIYGLAVLLPTLAVQFRRLHDTDRSAWWILIWLIPLVGWIILLVFNVLPGTQGPNRYGPDPKAGEMPVGAQPQT